MRQKIREEVGITGQSEYRDTIWRENGVFIRERTFHNQRVPVTLYSAAYGPEVATWIGPYSTYEAALNIMHPWPVRVDQA